jgi:hypothetical protein
VTFQDWFRRYFPRQAERDSYAAMELTDMTVSAGDGPTWIILPPLPDWRSVLWREG